MKLESIHIANGANVTNGLLSIENSGWEFYNVGLFPTTFAGVVAGCFVLAPEDFEKQQFFAVRVGDADGHIDSFEASGIIDTNRPPAPPGVDSRIPFAVPFSAVVREPTIGRVTLLIDGTAVATLTVAIQSSVPNSPE